MRRAQIINIHMEERLTIASPMVYPYYFSTLWATLLLNICLNLFSFLIQPLCFVYISSFFLILLAKENYFYFFDELYHFPKVGRKHKKTFSNMDQDVLLSVDEWKKHTLKDFCSEDSDPTSYPILCRMVDASLFYNELPQFVTYDSAFRTISFLPLKDYQQLIQSEVCSYLVSSKEPFLDKNVHPIEEYMHSSEEKEMTVTKSNLKTKFFTPQYSQLSDQTYMLTTDKIPVENTLYSSFYQFLRPFNLEGSRYILSSVLWCIRFCNHCQKEVYTTKTYSITSLPAFLYIQYDHLKQKDMTCAFPNQFDLSAFLKTNNIQNPMDYSTKYNLICVFNRTGSSRYDGHYYCYCADQIEDSKLRLYNYDDLSKGSGSIREVPYEERCRINNLLLIYQNAKLPLLTKNELENLQKQYMK